ncbi:hypothetical protein LCGC14_0371310 [marine sediment metagenome]|uniref:Uncharacterized protein n=1 Tax=marine sediment metagenome TaxID=412755 RepID=A0A0F9TAV3_9ZZZZ
MEAETTVKHYNCLECDHYKDNGWSCPFTVCIYPTMTVYAFKPTIVKHTSNSVVVSLD